MTHISLNEQYWIKTGLSHTTTASWLKAESCITLVRIFRDGSDELRLPADRQLRALDGHDRGGPQPAILRLRVTPIGLRKAG